MAYRTARTLALVTNFISLMPSASAVASNNTLQRNRGAEDRI